MARMRKTVSLLLCAALLFSFGGLLAAAGEPLPESEHDYANNFEQRWDYTDPG